MHARDAAGRQVSLLNDDCAAYAAYHKVRPYRQQRPLSFQSASHVLCRPPYPSPRSHPSSPDTPQLLRSDSYDSQMSNDPISPLTPSADYAYARPSLATLYPPVDAPPARPPAYVHSSRSTSFDDDSPPLAEHRPGKRFPCRYRDSHGCDKTFTTSGHASRHSKIHTAEKAVQCTFPGCHKKFTRADNMKQHLETHYKDRTRCSPAGPGARAHNKAALAAARRNSAASARSRSAASTPSSTTSTSSVDPAAPRATPSSGLDALAMAVACQEGAAHE